MGPTLEADVPAEVAAPEVAAPEVAVLEVAALEVVAADIGRLGALRPFGRVTRSATIIG